MTPISHDIIPRMRKFIVDRISKGQLFEDWPVRSVGEISNRNVSPVHQLLTSSALILGTAALWMLLHRYAAFSADGQIYAIQALSRIQPALASDLYLQNTSQDQFTIFSPIYAWFMARLGLAQAGQLLFIIFTVWFLVASWQLATRFFGSVTAWVAIALVVIIVGDYGAFGVFRYNENFLTARLPAEALALTGLAIYFRGLKLAGLMTAVCAMTLHPLMALPVVLLITCLLLPLRMGIVGAALGIIGTLGIATFASSSVNTHKFLLVMDSPWLEVVRERSQFLFLQLWSINDWELTAKPFLSLSLTILALQDTRVRKLCLASMLVGSAGLIVAAIASEVGPVAILLQGQAWRWVWIPTFISVLTVIPTTYRLWQNEGCGPLCAILLLAGWTIAAVNGTGCILGALVLWSLRRFVIPRQFKYFRWGAIGLCTVIVTWVFANAWTTLSTAAPETGREAIIISQIRNVVGLGVSALIIFAAFYRWILLAKNAGTLIAACLSLSLGLYWLAPSSFRQIQTFDQVGTVSTDLEMSQFADWRNVIPPESTVFVTNGHDLGSFVWFTLDRPNYLSVGQSAGVVFSRDTAMEVRRRSDILLPVMDPQWKLLSSWTTRGQHKLDGKSSPFRPLTTQTLTGICSDPLLGFVVSRDLVPAPYLQHTNKGPWKDWKLYDCRNVRLGPSA